MRGFRTASRVMEGSWKTALVRSFLSEEQLDDLDIPEEEIADYIIKQIVPFVKAHLLDAMKATNENFDQFVVNRLADQGILAVEQQEKIIKVMQVLAAAKTQISNQVSQTRLSHLPGSLAFVGQSGFTRHRLYLTRR